MSASPGPAMDAIAQCPHAERCPGCDHVGVPYGAQLSAKAGALASALAPYPEHRGVEVTTTRGAPTFERYRTRAKWVAGRGGALGLYARGGHEVVDLPGCAVASEVVASATAAVRALVRGRTCPGVAASLRALDVREILGAEGETRCLLTLVLVRERRPARRELAEAARLLRAAEPRIAGVAVNWAPARAVQILGDETEHLDGASELLDAQGSVLVTALPGAFVQAHRAQAAAMAGALVARAAALSSSLSSASASTSGPAPLRVLELFSGAAPFGLALARAGHDVTSVESFAPAAQGALRAAAAQGLRLTSIAEDAAQATARLAKASERFDLVVVDPPRRGLSPPLRAAIAGLAPRAVAYVSCDPSTFARDLAHLAHLGLRAHAVEPWDFIPLSAHVEAFAWLEPAAPPPVEVLGRFGDHAVVDLPAHLGPAPFAARVAREAGVGATFTPTWPGASGALRVGSARSAGATARVLAAVRGRPRRGLTGPWRSLEVLRTAGGRALVRIEAPAEALPTLARAFARAGHPVLGDERDGPTARHLAEKHGVDRPLVHVESVSSSGDASSGQPTGTTNIPGDLACALDRLGLR